MTFVLRFLFLYLLRCEDCGKYTLALSHGNALAACYDHDDRCRVQTAKRLTAAEVRTEPDLTPAGVVVDRYPTAGGAHVTVTTIDPDTATGAPGWVAECSGCGWSDDQYACWHELWPAYPRIAGGDVRGLLLDTAQEHADTCDGLAAYVTAAGAWVRIVRKEIEGWSPIPTSDGPAFSITTGCEACGNLREEHASVASGYGPRLVERAQDEARVHVETCNRLPERLMSESEVTR